jgi:hypothetical protein
MKGLWALETSKFCNLVIIGSLHCLAQTVQNYILDTLIFLLSLSLGKWMVKDVIKSSFSSFVICLIKVSEIYATEPQSRGTSSDVLASFSNCLSVWSKPFKMHNLLMVDQGSSDYMIQRGWGTQCTGCRTCLWQVHQTRLRQTSKQLNVQQYTV